MTFEIGYSQQHDYAIAAGTGQATTAGGSTGGVQGTGTGDDALVAQGTDEIVTSTSPDICTPESQIQYALRDLVTRLPPKQVYMVPCIWGDLEYWMDS